MKLATGVDMIEVERVQRAVERHGERLLQKVFTPAEILEARGKVESLAVRFAAKEAVSKALGTGIGPVGWREIEILHGAEGEPYVHLHGEAAGYGEKLGLTTWSVSMSHTVQHAIAMVVAIGD